MRLAASALCCLSTASRVLCRSLASSSCLFKSRMLFCSSCSSGTDAVRQYCLELESYHESLSKVFHHWLWTMILQAAVSQDAVLQLLQQQDFCGQTVRSECCSAAPAGNNTCSELLQAGYCFCPLSSCRFRSRMLFCNSCSSGAGIIGK